MPNEKEINANHMTGYPAKYKPWMKYYDETILDFNFPLFSGGYEKI